MKHYFVTGASSGIGRQFIQAVLKEQEDIRVYGCARHAPEVQDPRFTFFKTDLSEVSQVKALCEAWFTTVPEGDEVVLLNNAGTIGHIGYTGDRPEGHYEQLFVVNTLAPVLLTEAFIRRFQEYRTEKIILNISSGAAQKDMEGWAAYCASKAALDRFTTVCVAEQKRKNFPVDLYSVSPGVIDTPMQRAIRAADATRFPMHEHFMALYEEGQLTSPETAAAKLLRLLREPDLRTGPLLSLRFI